MQVTTKENFRTKGQTSTEFIEIWLKAEISQIIMALEVLLSTVKSLKMTRRALLCHTTSVVNFQWPMVVQIPTEVNSS